MENNKVIIYFGDYSDSDLETIAGIILASCKGNVLIIFTAAIIAALETSLKEYTEALADSKDGGKMSKAKKNEKRAILLEALHDTGVEANYLAKGNLEKLLSTKIPLVGKPKHVALPAPTGLDVKRGNISGVFNGYVDKISASHFGIDIACTPVDGAPDDINSWTRVHSTSYSFTLEGLIPGVKYKISVAYTGPKGTKLVWCAAIEIMAA